MGSHWDLIFQFLILMFVVSGSIIFVLHRLFISSVDGAKQRLEREADAARAKAAELNRKIADADQELKKRRIELDALERKIKGELEVEANREKEAILQKARAEAEDIIAKAQGARDTIRRDIEKTMELKIIDYAVKILKDILSTKGQGELDRQLVTEFAEKLKNVDMSKIPPTALTAEVVTAGVVDAKALADISQLLETKLGRKIQVTNRKDPKVLGGVALQFGTLMLDGSLQAALRDAAVLCKQDAEKQK